MALKSPNQGKSIMWNRFDIIMAYHHFVDLTLYRGMPYDYPTASRKQFHLAMKLEAIRYKPGLSSSHIRTCSNNAKAIYMGLVRKHVGIYSAKKNPVL